MIKIVLGSPRRGFRRTLAADLQRHPDIHLVAETGEPGHLRLLAANSRASVVVLDACWMPTWPDLIGDLAASPAPPRILLSADSLTEPEVLAAVEQGVHGCLPNDAQPATWHKAIIAIDAGETWIPRWLMAEALADLKGLLPAGLPALLNLERLTERQCEIVRWVTQGLSNKEIGQRMGISPTTVKTHMQNIFERVGVHGRRQLAMQVRRQRAAA